VVAWQVDETAWLQRKGVPPTVDEAKYTWDHAPAGKVQAIFSYDGFLEEAIPDPERPLGLVLDRTAFYAEAGGQVRTPCCYGR
jgi:alanyl-tRNA synthetase